MKISKEDNKLLFIEPIPNNEEITLATSATFPALDKIIERKRQIEYELNYLDFIREVISVVGVENMVSAISENTEITMEIIGYLQEKFNI